MQVVKLIPLDKLQLNDYWWQLQSISFAWGQSMPTTLLLSLIHNYSLSLFLFLDFQTNFLKISIMS